MCTCAHACTYVYTAMHTRENRAPSPALWYVEGWGQVSECDPKFAPGLGRQAVPRHHEFSPVPKAAACRLPAGLGGPRPVVPPGAAEPLRLVIGTG